MDMESRMGEVLGAATLGFTVLFFWMHNLRCRLQSLVDRHRSLER
jgi:hypothetical protein